MAQIGSVYATETTLQTHTGNTTYTTKFTVLGSAFDDSTKYMMLVRAQIGGDSNALQFKFRIQIGGSTLEGSEMIVEVSSGTADRFNPYTFLHVFTTAATAEDVTFQIAPNNSASTIAKADTITLFALKLDDLDSADWFFAEDTTDGDHTTGTTWGDEASITFTPANTNDDWLIIAWGSVHINHLTKNWRYRINESVSGDLEPLMSQEGEDVSDEWPWMLCRPYTLTAAEHVFKVQSNDDSAGGNENQHNISKIFALRLNAFEQHVISWDGGTFDTVGTVFAEIADMAFTPDTTGNGVVIGSVVNPALGNFYTSSLRIQLAGATIPTGSDANKDARSFDGTDFTPITVFARFAVTASTLADVDIDCRIDNTDGDFVDAGFAAWSLELASAGGTTYEESLSDDITLGASEAVVVAFEPTLTDDIALADAASAPGSIFNPILTDDIALADGLTPEMIAEASLSDDIALSDSALGGLVFETSVADDIALADTPAAAITLDLTLADDIALASSEAAHVDFVVERTDDIALGDTVTAPGSTYNPSVSDDIALADSAAGAIEGTTGGRNRIIGGGLW